MTEDELATVKVGSIVRQKQTDRLFRLDVRNDKVFQGWMADGEKRGCGGPISILRGSYELVPDDCGVAGG